MYGAQIVPLGSTACVVSVNEEAAKVECIMTDVLTLREQLNLYDTEQASNPSVRLVRWCSDMHSRLLFLLLSQLDGGIGMMEDDDDDDLEGLKGGPSQKQVREIVPGWESRGPRQVFPRGLAGCKRQRQRRSAEEEEGRGEEGRGSEATETGNEEARGQEAGRQKEEARQEVTTYRQIGFGDLGRVLEEEGSLRIMLGAQALPTSVRPLEKVSEFFRNSYCLNRANSYEYPSPLHPCLIKEIDQDGFEPTGLSSALS